DGVEDGRLAGRPAVDADDLHRGGAADRPAHRVAADRGHAAVDDERRAGDEARLVAREIDRGAGDVLGPPVLGPRLRAVEELAHRLRAAAMEQRRVDAAGADAVHADAV